MPGNFSVILVTFSLTPFSLFALSGFNKNNFKSLLNLSSPILIEAEQNLIVWSITVWNHQDSMNHSTTYIARYYIVPWLTLKIIKKSRQKATRTEHHRTMASSGSVLNPWILVAHQYMEPSVLLSYMSIHVSINIIGPEDWFFLPRCKTMILQDFCTYGGNIP